MSWKPLTFPALFSILITGSVALAGSQGKDEVSQNLAITVFVYNYAQVPANSIERAEGEAGRIFRQIGVEIAWRDCPTTVTPGTQDSACEQFLDSASLIVRIVHRFQLVPGMTNKQTMGSSVGNLATVSYHWIQEQVASGVATPSEILGPAIAHELGHVLLGRRGHSRVGIMRAHWCPDDFQRYIPRAFAFTPEEAELILSRAKLRAAAQAGRVELSRK
jgi:hypothetical protein